MTQHTLQAVGIGDLHLDGHYASKISDYNTRVIGDVASVLNAARKKGVGVAFLYGDVGHRSTLSEESIRLMVELFHAYPDFTFHVLKGNHDMRDAISCGLDQLAWTCSLSSGLASRVFFYRTEPSTVEIEGVPVQFLPYPHTSTRKTALNVLHADAVGTKRENGRAVTKGFDPKHASVVGHNHVNQVVGNAHYSGTLYQTRFGEPAEKFYHLIHAEADNGKLTGFKVKSVPFSPSIILVDAVVTSEEKLNALVDVASTNDGVTRLFRVYVNTSKYPVTQSEIDRIPGVVKTMSYTTKRELQLLRESAALEQAEEGVADIQAQFDVSDGFSEWARRHDIDPVLQQRAVDKLTKYLTTKQS